MVFTFGKHLQLACPLFFTTLILSHELVWEIQEVSKIQQLVFKFLLPFRNLHEFSLYYGVMVFTCENHLILARIFLYTTSFFYHELVHEIEEDR